MPRAMRPYRRPSARSVLGDLNHYLQNVGKVFDKNLFMAALEPAVQHLHQLGSAHNDINPANNLVVHNRMRALVDFGSCHEFGQRLETSRGTDDWIDPKDDYKTSEKEHDTSTLDPIRALLNQLSFSC
jgi:serine/threonine protein kinase